MIEYYPWSKEVLNQCLEDSRKGKIPALDIELTAKCTRAYCIYCDSKPAVSACENPNEMDFLTLKQAVIEAKKHGLKWVYSCGLGEPMEDRKFWEMVSLFRDEEIKFSMFSNGLFIEDIETARRLKEYDVNIILKMDTFDEINFDIIMGKTGSAQKTYRARDLLLEAGYGPLGNGYTNLAFSIVPTTLSIDGIARVISYCKERGVFASIGELEQAGEVLNHNLHRTIGLSLEQITSLKKIADEYYDGSYMRPICPCIMTGIHIDNIGNCIVDSDTGLNCKWFLLQEPRVHVVGNLKNNNIYELYQGVLSYRKKVFDSSSIIKACDCDNSYVFGGCGGNPKDIAYIVKEEMAR